MRQKQDSRDAVEKTVRDIKRRTRRQFSAEDKIRIVLQGLRGEESIAEICSRHRPQLSSPAGECAIAADNPERDPSPSGPSMPVRREFPAWPRATGSPEP